MRYPSGMENLPVVKIEFDEVSALADLLGYRQDLISVIQMTKRLADILRQDQEEQDALMARSLWTSALITYMRCFATGKRHGLTEAIYAHLPGEPIATHGYYKDVRDKHIAHSVNAFEETLIGVILSSQEGDSIDVLGVASMSAFRVYDSVEGVEQLGMLAVHALRYVEQEAKEAQEGVLSRANSLSAEQLRTLPRLGTIPQGGADAAKTPRL